MGFHITYEIQDIHWIVHTKDGEVRFNKDDMGLPYINTKKPQDVAFVKIFC